MEGKMNGGMCNCPHHKVVPGLVIAFGLAFLLSAMGVITYEARNIIWPIIIIAGGFMKLSNGMCKCCDGETCHC